MGEGVGRVLISPILNPTWSVGIPGGQDAQVELAGKVVVVPVTWEGATQLAVSLGSRGATVVLVGPDGESLGRLAATLPGRPAVFVSDGSPESAEALAAFVSELFRPRS
jgi:hypothetical protein